MQALGQNEVMDLHAVECRSAYFYETGVKSGRLFGVRCLGTALVQVAIQTTKADAKAPHSNGEQAQGKEFELSFPVAVHCNKLVELCAHNLDWSEPSAGAFASVLAVDLAEQLVTTRGEKFMRVFDIVDRRRAALCNAAAATARTLEICRPAAMDNSRAVVENYAELLGCQLFPGERMLECPAPHESQVGQSMYLSFTEKQIVGLITPQTVSIANDHRVEFAWLESDARRSGFLRRP